MKAASIALLLVLSACDRDRPPEPDADQHAKLDEAEAMLNDMAANEEGAAPEDTAPPSNQQG
jgi:hypothetical protein